MKWKLITEKETPSDSNVIQLALDGKCNDKTKYSPSIKFMSILYDKLNELVFMDMLPSDLKFKIIDAIDDYAGDTIIGRSAVNGSNMLFATTIVFNNSIKLTIPDWIDVMVHEMIHVYDIEYCQNHYHKEKYERHGDWFLNMANKLNKKYGFDVKDYFDKDFEVNDEPLKLYVNHAVVVEKTNGKRFVVIISDHDKDKCLEYIFNEMNIDEVTVFTTSNQDIECLDKLNPTTGEFKKYECDYDFIEKFGPFYDIQKMSLKDKFIKESIDDEPEDIKILRKIDGIRDIRRVDWGWEFHMS